MGGGGGLSGEGDSGRGEEGLLRGVKGGRARGRKRMRGFEWGEVEAAARA